MSSDSRFYRRPPGAGWVLALVAVPLLLALIGWGASHGKRDAVAPAMPSVDASASSTIPATAAAPPSAEAGQPFGAMSIVRSGNGFTLTGELPDAASKTSLTQALGQAMPGARIVDDLVVKPGVRGPEFSGLGGLFGAAMDVPGFSAKLADGTVTLAGTAPSLVAKASAESAAVAAWPNVKVVNDIQVSGTGAAPAPAAPAADRCATLQADVSALLSTPINFANGGFTLDPGSRRLLGQIADRLKACPTAKIAVVGHTDDSGTDRVNLPLSVSRAKAVADELISDGVTASGVTSRGAGSEDPVAGNDSPTGRAQNRRVEITVG